MTAAAPQLTARSCLEGARRALSKDPRHVHLRELFAKRSRRAASG